MELTKQKNNITNKKHYILLVINLLIISIPQSTAKTKRFYDDGLKTPVQGDYTAKVYSPAGDINGVGRKGYTDEGCSSLIYVFKLVLQRQKISNIARINFIFFTFKT